MAKNRNQRIFSYFPFLIDINKVVICFCLFVCPIITHEPHDQIAANFDLWNSGEPGECSQFSFEILSGVGRLLQGNIAKIVFLDHTRVNGGSNWATLCPHMLLCDNVEISEGEKNIITFFKILFLFKIKNYFST